MQISFKRVPHCDFDTENPFKDQLDGINDVSELSTLGLGSSCFVLQPSDHITIYFPCFKGGNG